MKNFEEIQKENKERLREYNKNRIYDKESKIEYYQKNKESILEKRKKNYSLNRDSKLGYQKEYGKNNKEKRNLYLMERRQNDPLFRLITNVRNLIYNSFYYNGYSKNSKTEELLGCSFEEFKTYSES
jgi:hypothetical protein